MYEKIEKKLENAAYISLIPDIWTSKRMLDFCATAVSKMSETFQREILVVGMGKMPGNHYAENIKAIMETLINRYEFDKSKIKGLFFSIEISK